MQVLQQSLLWKQYCKVQINMLTACINKCSGAVEYFLRIRRSVNLNCGTLAETRVNFLMRCLGSGSAWFRIDFALWIRVRIGNSDPATAPGARYLTKFYQ
jgi:hypothetical protein